MAHSHDHVQLPRSVLVGAAVLVCATILGAALARTTGIGRTEMPPGRAVQVAELQFEDHARGGIVARALPGGEIVARISPGEDGFVRGVLRGFARARKLAGVGREPPFVLTRWADGRLSMHDPHTEHFVALEAFGPTNAAAFARLMPAAPAPSASGRQHDDRDGRTESAFRRGEHDGHDNG